MTRELSVASKAVCSQPCASDSGSASSIIPALGQDVLKHSGQRRVII